MTNRSGPDPAVRDRETARSAEIAARARAEFPLLESFRYLDIATKAPLGRGVREALEGFLESRQTAHQDKAAWRPTVEAVRKSFAALIGATPSEIALVKNTSEALNAVAHSIPWQPGDNAVLAATEHPNNLYPWLHVGRRHGVEIRLAESDLGVLTPERLAALMDDHTRAVAVSAVSFLPGVRADMRGLAETCGARGAYLVVDAIQAAGILRCDVTRTKIDALAAGGHKGLLGPYGAGFLYCRHNCLVNWDPPYAANASIRQFDGPYEFVDNMEYAFLPTAARYEIGNYNYEGLHAQKAALDFLASFHPEYVEAHVLELSGRFGHGLRALGVHALNPEEASSRSGIVSFRWGRAAQLRAELLRRRTVVALKGDAIRVSFHLFNTVDDVDGLLNDLKELL